MESHLKKGRDCHLEEEIVNHTSRKKNIKRHIQCNIVTLGTGGDIDCEELRLLVSLLMAHAFSSYKL